MLTKIEKYPEYKASLSKLNKAKLRFENMQKLSEESQKISDKLSTTLGISKVGEQINFDQIDKAERQTKIKSREVKIAEKEYLKAEADLKDTIEKIRKLKLKDAQKIGLRLSRTIVKAINMLCKSREEYGLLNNEMKTHFGEIVNKEGFRQKDFSSVVGPECRFMLNKLLFYKGFLRTQKEYQKKVKDI
ncbi:hypothetical protein ES702_02829 [subsurface metagenome]